MILIENLPLDLKKVILLQSSSLLLKNNSILGIDLVLDDDIIVSACANDFCENMKQSKKIIQLLLVCFIAFAIVLLILLHDDLHC